MYVGPGKNKLVEKLVVKLALNWADGGVIGGEPQVRM
jgi:hypothetical protein